MVVESVVEGEDRPSLLDVRFLVSHVLAVVPLDKVFLQGEVGVLGEAGHVQVRVPVGVVHKEDVGKEIFWLGAARSPHRVRP